MLKHVKGIFADGSTISAWWFPGTKTVNVCYSDMPDYGVESVRIDRTTLLDFVNSMWNVEYAYYV